MRIFLKMILALPAKNRQNFKCIYAPRGADEMREKRCLPPGTVADLKHGISAAHLQLLKHEGHRVRLRYRLPSAYGERRIFVCERLQIFRNEIGAVNFFKRCEYRRGVQDSGLLQMGDKYVMFPHAYSMTPNQWF